MSARDLSIPNGIAELARRAKQAGAVSDLMSASFAEEREAAEALLRTALAAAKPALSAICTPEKFSSVPLRVALIGVIDSKDPPLRRQLYVNEGGHLLEAVYEFKENHWPIVEFGTFDGPASALKAGYRVEDVVARLLRLCGSVAYGGGTKRAEESQRRTERLRAIATLVDAVGGGK